MATAFESCHTVVGRALLVATKGVGLLWVSLGPGVAGGTRAATLA